MSRDVRFKRGRFYRIHEKYPHLEPRFPINEPQMIRVLRYVGGEYFQDWDRGWVGQILQRQDILKAEEAERPHYWPPYNPEDDYQGPTEPNGPWPAGDPRAI